MHLQRLNLSNLKKCWLAAEDTLGTQSNVQRGCVESDSRSRFRGVLVCEAHKFSCHTSLG